ncbi:hypothetical protein HPP92_019022 [Vanilla planifolia]|uniref:Uncharacterized protein n=1 Tax=Vanilla planifolia TaxID=51239 RepID=A0A835UKK2_VANPL|nr:hypothetical protein HPP92_019022 [Vanilla planifolia]
MRRNNGHSPASAKPDRSEAAVGKISEVTPSIPHRQRRHPAIVSDTSKSRARFAEIAGATTAECVAICCCCPCGLFNLVILAALRLPASLCRRAFRRRLLLRRAKKRTALLGSGSGSGSGGSSNTEWSATEVDDVADLSGMRFLMFVGDSWPMRSPAAEVLELEEEVWSKFYSSGGFWRSLSQREGILGEWKGEMTAWLCLKFREIQAVCGPTNPNVLLTSSKEI